MSVAFTSWLPESALCGGQVRRVIGETVTEWSRKWLVRWENVRVSDAPAECSWETGCEQWKALEGELAVCTIGKARLALAALMLGRTQDIAGSTEADLTLLTGLAEAGLTDLRGRLARAFKFPADVRWEAWATGQELPPGAAPFVIETGSGEPLVGLFVAPDLIVATVKSSIARMPNPIRLNPLPPALGRQKVLVSALLGRCGLSLADLAGMTEGDVLILDRELQHPLELTLNRRPGRGRAVLDQRADQLTLKILEPLIDEQIK